MKSKDVQNIVFRKYQDSDTPSKIFRDLNGCLGLTTIKRWCKMIRDNGTIELSPPSGRPRLSRTSKVIQKVKHKLTQNKVSVRGLANEIGVSTSSVHRILKEDRQLHADKTVIEPKLTGEQKNKRKQFAN
ncbi:unnamed protein product [Rotaria magnacalcarata]|nr:unnamed protein product [Rotaria magnacalcarata]CAF1670450.1 unnamed protein product [Rotaria magnacalcarata]CAF2191451.1 unnamed protein product [Rotaria magnacalcarata]